MYLKNILKCRKIKKIYFKNKKNFGICIKNLISIYNILYHTYR